jgi:hypothetical protein
MKNIKDHGEPKQYCNIDGEDFFLHWSAYESGGFVMRDDDGLIPKAVKEMIGKLASNLIKGKIFDLTKNASPAYLHHYVSQ